MAILGQPIGLDTPRDAGEQMTGQVRNVHPGQDEEARVVRHQRQIARACRCQPTDPGIARAAFSRCRAEQQAGHRAPVAAVNEVRHVLAHGVAQAQFVVGGEHTTKPPVLVAGGVNAGDPQPPQLLQRTDDRLAAMGYPNGARLR